MTSILSKRITDKERLNWLQKNKAGVAFWFDGTVVVGQSWKYFPTLRQAIDAEIKRSKFCGQCGKPYTFRRACGPTHAVRANELRRAKRRG